MVSELANSMELTMTEKVSDVAGLGPASVAFVCALTLITGTARVHEPEALLLGAKPAQHSEPRSLVSDLIYHGGNRASASASSPNPGDILIFWVLHGQRVTTRTPLAPVHEPAAQNYITSFLTVCGTSWAAIQSEYCRNVRRHTTCADVADADYVTNPRNNSKGVD